MKMMNPGSVFLVVTLFSFVFILSSIIPTKISYSQPMENLSETGSGQNFTFVNGTIIDLVKDPFFILVANDSNLSSYWNDPLGSCIGLFVCNLSNTDGWVDNQSFQLTTTNSTDNTWSWISGQEVEVEPDQEYELLTHMKTNEWATQSHITLEAFNESSQEWYQIIQCPSGTDGPMTWKEFDCKVKIPADTTVIVPILNAGWSSIPDREAVTLFDAIHLYRLK